MAMLDLQVEADADNGYGEIAAESWQGGAAVIIFGHDGAVTVAVIHRFLNVTIPKDAEIISAVPTFNPRFNRSGTVVNTQIHAEDIADSVQVTNDTTFGTLLARLTATNVTWDGLGAWVTDAEEVGPDIKTIVQYIVNLPSWVSGNSINLVVMDDGSSLGANRGSWPHSLAPSKALKLHIEFAAAEGDVDTFPGGHSQSYMVYR